MSGPGERTLRDALGLFATGVCLVTVTDGDGAAHAITVNSFASVSLEPPLILWSLQNDSEAYGLYAHAPLFGIGVLNAGQQALSERYARRGGHFLDADHFDFGTNGAPLIRDALVNFECRLETAYAGGDHRILLGRITRVAVGEDRPPLLFHGGAYRGLA